MDILYVSYYCEQQYFKKIFNSAKIKPAQAPQKYHRLMVEGLTKNGANVLCLTGRPITTRTHSKKIWKGEVEICNSVKYKYIPFINYGPLKHLSYLFFSFFYTLFWCISRKNKAVVLDILCDPIAKGSALAGRLCGTIVNGIVTDLPEMINFDNRDYGLLNSLSNRLSVSPIKLCTQYTVLTAQMLDVVNPHGKPFTIVEGLADFSMSDRPRVLPTDGKHHICYMGQIYEQFGVKSLVEAFMSVKNEDCVLDIFGPGPMAEMMPGYMEKDHRIVYHGCVSMEESVAAQLSAYLLVNPRPTSVEFTKYSFPSKNIEYMASGAPLLTTRLPGMPKEYYDYVFLFEEETEEGMSKTLNNILKMSEEDVRLKGQRGKEFVLSQKNNIVQAEKLYRLLTL